jgi:hypothetical protein
MIGTVIESSRAAVASSRNSSLLLTKADRYWIALDIQGRACFSYVDNDLCPTAQLPQATLHTHVSRFGRSPTISFDVDMVNNLPCETLPESVQLADLHISLFRLSFGFLQRSKSARISLDRGVMLTVRDFYGLHVLRGTDGDLSLGLSRDFRQPTYCSHWWSSHEPDRPDHSGDCYKSTLYYQLSPTCFKSGILVPAFMLLSGSHAVLIALAANDPPLPKELIKTTGNGIRPRFRGFRGLLYTQTPHLSLNTAKP